MSIIPIIITIIIAIITIILVIFIPQEASEEQDILCHNTMAQNIVKEYFKTHKNAIIIPSDDFNKMKQKVDSKILMIAIANYAKTLATHVVISHYQVGACVLGKSGNVYLGANCEFKNTLPNTIHGEQCAIHNASVHNEKGLESIAINASPCGQCRQFMVELGDPKEFDVMFCDNDNISMFSLETLIPNNFGPENLNLSGRLLTTPALNLIPTENMNQLDKVAFDMAVNSYVPYTKRACGIALKIGDTIVPGKTLENAAYNPSSSACRNAFSLASIMGLDLSKITDMVMVECCEGDQGSVSRRKEGETILASVQDKIKMVYIPVDMNNGMAEEKEEEVSVPL